MIPLIVPELRGNEWKYVKKCLDTGWVSMAGSFVTDFEDSIVRYTNSQYAIAAVNGTCGLHIALHILGINQEHHVLLPNLTFVASANSVAYTGADAIFIDVHPDTWQMDLDLLETFLNDKCTASEQGPIFKETNQIIKAIMPVHVLGNMCDMERLCRISEEFNLLIIEDASESLGSYYNGKHSGTFGDFGVFSFNGNKIITTGGGGMIVTNNSELAKRAKHITTQAKTNPETYFHDEVGYNYRLVNVLAAIGVAQMEQLDKYILKKKQIDSYYRKHLENVGDIRFQEIKQSVNPNCWLFTFRSKFKDQLIASLKSSNIHARPFWTPMNQLPMYSKNRYIYFHDYSRFIHNEGVSIPSSVGISEENLNCVTNSVRAFFI